MELFKKVTGTILNGKIIHDLFKKNPFISNFTKISNIIDYLLNFSDDDRLRQFKTHRAI